MIKEWEIYLYETLLEQNCLLVVSNQGVSRENF
jgi:hypothetical protein